MRRAVLTAFSLLAACAFEDPNAPPPKDPCISGSANPADQGAYWARIDGPAPCSNATDPDTISHFTGSGWNEPSAMCRAIDLFLGATPVNNAMTLKLEKGLSIPPNAFGYCIVNKGTASEVVSYSVCGQPEAGKGACEKTLPQQASIEVTAEWVGCPGGALCYKSDPALADDVCASIGESDVSHSYAVWVDVPFLYCDQPSASGDAGAEPEPTLEDEKDSLFVTLGSAYNRQSSMCTAASVFDHSGLLQYDASAPERQDPAPRNQNGERTGTPPFDKLAPTGAKGYCHYGDDKSTSEAVLYTLCDLVVGKDPAKYSPKALCEKGFPRAAKPRLGKWSACPGGSLCPK